MLGSSREQNADADEMSRCLDWDDWGILPHIVSFLSGKWGTPNVDLFASYRNCVCEKFIGLFPSGDTRQVASLALSAEASPWWNYGLLWVVPPPKLIAQTVLSLRAHRSKAILGIPFWPSSAFFPMLKMPGGEWIKEVLDGSLFPVGARIIKTPSLPSNDFSFEFTTSEFVFLFIDFSGSQRTKTLNF